jgi:ABC-type multidrug transport system fused ATPase/permease subunit
MSSGSIISSIVIAFLKAPIFACICLFYVPIAVLLMRCFGSASKNASFNKSEAYIELGKFTKEMQMVPSMKLIVAFCQEKLMFERFKDKAEAARDIANSANYWQAFMSGFLRLLIFGFFIYAYFFASIFLTVRKTNPQTKQPYTTE